MLPEESCLQLRIKLKHKVSNQDFKLYGVYVLCYIWCYYILIDLLKFQTSFYAPIIYKYLQIFY